MIASLASALVQAPQRSARAENAPPAAAEAPARPRTIDISEYRVEGARRLTAVAVEEALTPYLGAGRTLDDVERARAALEKAYSDKGYQTVSVAIPQQRVVDGVILLRVTEGTVGRLRVRGSRWFSLGEIRQLAPSLAEGSVPDFNEIVRDIYALNQLPDRSVTPALRPGALPGTVDVDLNVKDTLPLHGSLEVNDRFSANTSVPRLNGTLRYDNLWQLGHSLNFSFQLAPVQPLDARVFSAAYVARFPSAPWLTLTFNGIWQDSDISSLGAATVQGRGRIAGVRASFTLPGGDGFFHTVTAGFDYKHFGKELASDFYSAPITYVPGTIQWGGSWAGASAQTQLGATAVFNFRGLSSRSVNYPTDLTGSPQPFDAFDAKRYKASGSFIDYRGDLSHTRDVFGGFQLFGRIQGQYSTEALIPSEQITAGGVESVRGYLEAQAAGDLGFFGTLEARSPELAPFVGGWLHEWRLHVFGDGARLANRHPLPDQQWLFFLWSTGAGTRFKVFDNFNGSLDLGVPLRTQGSSRPFHPRLQFRLWAEF